MWLKKNLNLLVIIGACIIVFTFFNKKEDYVEEYNAKIKALEQQLLKQKSMYLVFYL